ncbi:MAG: hypothetical protein JW703_00750 [Candidatus Diapherotrites archaeon]|nr:hypothetical protein [Candidatus Diapherotrites archaeon]
MSGISSEKDIVFEVIPLPVIEINARLDDILQGTDIKYLSLILENNGDVDLTNLLIQTSTCFMKDSAGNNYFEQITLPRLSAGTSAELKFRNPKTIERFKEKTCEPYTDFFADIGGFSFNPYKSDLDQNVLACDICEYVVKISSDQKAFEAKRQTIRAPKKYNLTVQSKFIDQNISRNFIVFTELE